MALKEIKDLLKKTIGLNVSSVGASNFERAVRHRMKALGIHEVYDYSIKLRQADEMHELIDEVVVPETWFFRNPASFSALQQFAAEWRAEHPAGKKLMILSIPCSTGEEPYTIAMTLDQAGLQPDDYQIDAFDISQRLLSKAKRGVYGRNSFRNKENEFREQYFDLVGGIYVLNDKIRNAVNFQQGNLLDKYFGIGGQVYDVIFCRNLLIYFDRDTQNAVMQKFHKLLAEKGLLLLGHAETPDFLRGNFTRSAYLRSFSYNKVVNNIKPAQSSMRTPETMPPADAMKKSPPVTPQAKPHMEFLETVELRQADQLPQSDAAVLRDAARLANRGELREAGALCENYLRQNPTSAQAYYLLGLVREAEGKYQLVGELFKKAVYLDPNHYEAMIHLALHLVRYGDADSAKKLHQRAHRVLNRKKPE